MGRGGNDSHCRLFNIIFTSRKIFWGMGWVGSLFLTPSAVQALPLDWETLAALEHVVQEVVTRFPVQQYVMVGIGRSPAPLIAWLQELNPRAGFSVSATSLVPEELNHPNERIALLRLQLERLRADPRTRVAIDFVSQGTSLAVGSILLARADPSREQVADVHPRWQGLGLLESGRTWEINHLDAWVVREVQAAQIQVATVATSTHLGEVLAGERLKIFSEVGTQELGSLGVAPSSPENSLEAAQTRAALFRFAIRSYRATRTRTVMSEGEWRSLLQDLQRRETLSPARREEVAGLVFWSFHFWAPRPSVGAHASSLPASLGAQQAELLLALVRNPDWQVPGLRDPQPLLGMVMDRVGHQLSQAPNGEFSRRLTELITQWVQQVVPGGSWPQRLLEVCIQAGAASRSIFPRESGYRNGESELLSRVLQLLRRQPGFSASRLLESEVVREWVLENPTGPAFLWEWMAQAGPDAWLRWLVAAQTERQRWRVAHFVEDEIQRGNLTEPQRESLRVGLRSVRGCDAAMLRRVALYLRD